VTRVRLNVRNLDCAKHGDDHNGRKDSNKGSLRSLFTTFRSRNDVLSIVPNASTSEAGQEVVMNEVNYKPDGKR
jgi:hypothetical protein